MCFMSDRNNKDVHSQESKPEKNIHCRERRQGSQSFKKAISTIIGNQSVKISVVLSTVFIFLLNYIKLTDSLMQWN